MALKASKGDFDAPMLLSDLSLSDLKWWSTHIHTTFNPVSRGNPPFTIYSDASLSGWGGVINEFSTGGLFSEEEKTFHINYLEILACFLTLQTFCSDFRDCHIKAMIDNTTAISYMNNMGGRSASCNSVTRKLWLWCIERNFWVTAAHIPGKLNVLADTQSRQNFLDTECKLDPLVFQRISCHWGKPSIDLFASRLNFQLRPFISWKPDPEAFAIDAFSISWMKHNFYAFPLFAVINTEDFTENRTGSSTWHHHCSSLDHPNLVSSSVTHVSRISSSSTTLPSVTDPSHPPPDATPSSQQVKANDMQIIRDSLRARGVSKKSFSSYPPIMERNHSTTIPCLSQEVAQLLHQKGSGSLLSFYRKGSGFPT